jgi:hypothetical protein
MTTLKQIVNRMEYTKKTSGNVTIQNIRNVIFNQPQSTHNTKWIYTTFSSSFIKTYCFHLLGKAVKYLSYWTRLIVSDNRNNTIFRNVNKYLQSPWHNIQENLNFKQQKFEKFKLGIFCVYLNYFMNIYKARFIHYIHHDNV